MKKIIVVLLIVVTIMSSISFADVIAFSDLEDHWASEYIYEMAEQGFINGYEDGTYRPEGKLTRAEFAKLIAITFNLKGTAKHNYVDIGGHWAESYINNASKYMMDFKEGNKYFFKPDDPAVREDVTTALIRIGKYNISSVDESLLDNFRDGNSISEEFKKYVAKAVEIGMIKGYENNTFRPEGTLTRAEAAKIIAIQKRIETGNGYIDPEMANAIFTDTYIVDVNTYKKDLDKNMNRYLHGDGYVISEVDGYNTAKEYFSDLENYTESFFEQYNVVITKTINLPNGGSIIQDINKSIRGNKATIRYFPNTDPIGGGTYTSVMQYKAIVSIVPKKVTTVEVVVNSQKEIKPIETEEPIENEKPSGETKPTEVVKPSGETKPIETENTSRKPIKITLKGNSEIKTTDNITYSLSRALDASDINNMEVIRVSASFFDKSSKKLLTIYPTILNGTTIEGSNLYQAVDVFSSELKDADLTNVEIKVDIGIGSYVGYITDGARIWEPRDYFMHSETIMREVLASATKKVNLVETPTYTTTPEPEPQPEPEPLASLAIKSIKPLKSESKTVLNVAKSDTITATLNRELVKGETIEVAYMATCDSTVAMFDKGKETVISTAKVSGTTLTIPVKDIFSVIYKENYIYLIRTLYIRVKSGSTKTQLGKYEITSSDLMKDVMITNAKYTFNSGGKTYTGSTSATRPTGAVVPTFKADLEFAKGSNATVTLSRTIDKTETLVATYTENNKTSTLACNINKKEITLDGNELLKYHENVNATGTIDISLIKGDYTLKLGTLKVSFVDYFSPISITINANASFKKSDNVTYKLSRNLINTNDVENMELVRVSIVLYNASGKELRTAYPRLMYDGTTSSIKGSEVYLVYETFKQEYDYIDPTNIVIKVEVGYGTTLSYITDGARIWEPRDYFIHPNVMLNTVTATATKKIKLADVSTTTTTGSTSKIYDVNSSSYYTSMLLNTYSDYQDAKNKFSGLREYNSSFFSNNSVAIISAYLPTPSHSIVDYNYSESGNTLVFNYTVKNNTPRGAYSIQVIVNNYYAIEVSKNITNIKTNIKTAE